MKKIKTILFAFLVMGMLTTPVLAQDFGVLNQITDRVTPEGDNGKIVQVIVAETNEEGQVAFPKYSKTELVEVTASKGTLTGDPEEVEYGDTSYYLATFDEKGAEVEFTVTLTKEGLYVGKKAKLGDTFPNGAITVEHKVTNTSPNTIASYGVTVVAPEGKELLNIVDYDAEDPFTYAVEEGRPVGGYDFEEVKPGKEVKLALNFYAPQKQHTVMIWAFSAVISVAFMLKNKDLLKGKPAQE
jgi:hypothetical protein